MRMHHVFGILLASIVVSVFVTGCYTQVAGTRDDRDDNYYSSDDRDHPGFGYTDSKPGYDSTVTDSGRYDEESYETARHRVYFDYYYPHFSVGMGWYSPWYWGSGFAIGYDPFYSPWNYYSWGYPVVYPYPWYVYPQYRDPGYYGPYYSHNRFGGTRTFGNTRTGGNYRGGSAVYRGGGAPSITIPAGTRYAPRSEPRIAPRQQTGISPGRRSNESGRSGTTPPGRGYRSGSTRGGTREGYRNEPPRTRYDAPSRSGGSNRGGGDRSGGRSYSPSPAPPSHGGGAPPSSGSRGSSGSRESSGSRGGTRR